MASSVKQDNKSHRSLASLLRFFEGMELAVELKTGRTYRGVLSSADEYMNLTLDDATVDSNQSIALHVHIRGPSIRYIHFTDDADLPGLVRSGIDRERAAANKYRRGIRK